MTNAPLTRIRFSNREIQIAPVVHAPHGQTAQRRREGRELARRHPFLVLIASVVLSPATAHRRRGDRGPPRRPPIHSALLPSSAGLTPARLSTGLRWRFFHFFPRTSRQAVYSPLDRRATWLRGFGLGAFFPCRRLRGGEVVNDAAHHRAE